MHLLTIASSSGATTELVRNGVSEIVITDGGMQRVAIRSLVKKSCICRKTLLPAFRSASGTAIAVAGGNGYSPAKVTLGCTRAHAELESHRVCVHHSDSRMGFKHGSRGNRVHCFVRDSIGRLSHSTGCWRTDITAIFGTDTRHHV